MDLQTTAKAARKNALSTAVQLREDFNDFRAGRGNRNAESLDARQQKALADLHRDGFAVIEDYWTAERAIAMRDQLEALLAEGKDKDFDEGAWMRFWDGRGYDQGVRRIYHVDKVVPALKEARDDRWILDIASAYYGIPFYSGALVFQHNLQSNKNTRTYHVDAFIKEFKSFIYLDDVDLGNGPFAYVPGTQRKHLLRLKKQLIGNGEGESPTTVFPEDMTKAELARERAVTGKAGTLILADVRGLHRGTPQKDRSRSVLVNYIVKHQDDLQIDR
jgi:hypothetical protein